MLNLSGHSTSKTCFSENSTNIKTYKKSIVTHSLYTLNIELKVIQIFFWFVDNLHSKMCVLQCLHVFCFILQ